MITYRTFCISFIYFATISSWINSEIGVQCYSSVVVRPTMRHDAKHRPIAIYPNNMKWGQGNIHRALLFQPSLVLCQLSIRLGVCRYASMIDVTASGVARYVRLISCTFEGKNWKKNPKTRMVLPHYQVCSTVTCGMCLVSYYETWNVKRANTFGD